MKKVFILCTVLFFAQMTTYGQTFINSPIGPVIDSVVVTPILCDSDSTCATVYTSATGTATYSLEIFTPSPPPGQWLQHPSWMQVPGLAINPMCDLTAGTIRIIVEFPVSSGIKDTIEINISDPDPISNFITNVTNISCNGENDGSIWITSFLGTPSYTYTLNGAPAVSYAISPHVEIIPNLSPGIQTINIFDTNNCAYAGNPITQLITEPAAITVSSSTTNVSCFGGNDGTITVTASGGTVDYQYRINGGAYTAPTPGSHTFTTLSFGSYTIDVLDANGCDTFATINVIQPAIALSAVTTQSDVSCLGGNDGTITVTASGGTPPYRYQNNGGGYTAPTPGSHTFNFLFPGLYTIDVLDSNDCPFTTITVTVIEPGIALSAVTTPSDVSCFGGNDGTITVTASGGTSDYQYRINGGAYTAPTPGSHTFTTLSAGSHTIDVLDANNCPFPTTVTVGEPTNVLSVTTDIDSVSCNGLTDGSIIVTASGGTSDYQYRINGGAYTLATPGSHTFTTLSAGSHTIDVLDANNCSTQVIRNVFEPNPITVVDTNLVMVICNGDSTGTATVNLSGGTPGYTYSWNTNPIQTTPTAIGLWAGTFTCTVTDTNGCPYSLNPISVTITEPATALTIGGTDSTIIICNGDSTGTATVINVSGGTPAIGVYTYSWNTNPIQTTPTATGLWAGLYTVTVSDSNGCMATDSVTVPESLLPLIVTPSSSNVSCNGDNNGMATVSITGGVPVYTSSWSSGQTDTIISGLTAGVYTDTITDTWGCVHVETFIITEPLPITNTWVSPANDVLCNGDSTGTATANPSGGTPAIGVYTYSWNTNPIQTTPTATGLWAGTFTVTISDSNSCSFPASILIQEPAEIDAIENISHVSCNGDANGSIDLSVNGGNPYTIGGAPYTYLWSNASTTSIATGLTAGLYTVEITDSTLCKKTYVFTITEPSVALSATSTPSNYNGYNISCNGGNDGVLTANVVGGTPPYTYQWPGPLNSVSFINLVAGTYICYITDTNGCQTSTTATLIEPSPITITTSSNPASCFGEDDGTLTVTPTGGAGNYTYAWSNGQSTQTAIDLLAGTYSVWVTDANGCAAQAGPLTVGQPLQISAILNVTDILCNGDSNGVITVSGVGGTTPPYTYYWTPTNGNNVPMNINLTAGAYSVTITDGVGPPGCTRTFSATITEPTAIIASLPYSNISVTGGSDGWISVNASGGVPWGSGYTYTWTGSNGYTNTGANINSLPMGVYTVTITDSNSCSQSFSQAITQPNCNVNISATYTDPVCPGEMFELDWLNSGGLPPYTNTLTHSNGFIYPGVNLAQFNSPPPSLLPINLFAGVWNLVVIDAAGCPAILNIPVTTIDPITVILSLDSATCFGYNNGTASAAVSGGTAPYNIDWGSSLGVNPNQLIAGNYNVLITDSNGCISGPTNYTIGEPAQLVIDSLVTTDVSCTPGNDGTATVYASGGTLSYLYSWNNSQTTQTAQNLVTGTYIVTVTDANLCPTDTAAVIVAAAPLIFNFILTPISCNGYSDGELTANIISGALPFSYSWVDLSDPSVVISSNATVSNLSSGAYSLTVTDNNGCSKTEYTSLSNPSVISFSLLATPMTSPGANNGSINIINGNLGLPFNCNGDWTGPSGFTATTTFTSNNPTILTGLSPGIYTLIITDPNGCTLTLQAVIPEIACNVQVIPTVIQPLCFGNSGTFTWTNSGGSGSYDNTIINGSGLTIFSQNGISFSQILSEGSYTLYVEDSYGCYNIVNISIQAPNPLVANITTTPTSCFQGNDGSVSISVSGGTPNGLGAYIYNYGGYNPQAYSPGIYVVDITDVNGCPTYPDTLVFEIEEPDDILVTYDTTSVSCFGGTDGTASTAVTGGTYPYFYLWIPTGDTTQSVNNLVAGTYFVTVNDINGCSSTLGPTQVTITQPNSITNITFLTADPTCYGAANGMATANAVGGGAPPYHYLWSNGQTTQTAQGLSGGVYSCIVTDANGCITTDSTTIIEPAKILPIIAITKPSCNGDSNGEAHLTILGGTGPFAVLWGTGPTNYYSINGLSAGTFSVTVTETSNPFCNTTQIFVVEEPDILQLSTSVDSTSCFNGGDGEVSVSVTGGTTPYTYVWTDGNNDTISTTGLSAGYYTVAVIDSNGCSDTSGILVGSPNSIAPNFTVNPVSCNGGSDGSALVTPTGGTSPYTYIWNGSVTTSFAANYTGLNAATTYFVSIMDANFCTEVFPVTVPQPAPITPVIATTDPSCYGYNDGEINIDSIVGGVAPFSYVWVDSTTSLILASDSSYTGSLVAGTYSVIVIDNNMCTDTTWNLDIVDPPELIVTILPPVSFVSCHDSTNGALSATAVGGTPPLSYAWSNGDNLQATDSLSAGIYTATVTDDNGCSSSETITLSNPAPITFTYSVSDYNGYNVACYGNSNATISVSASSVNGINNSTYIWNTGLNDSVITSIGAGTYVVSVIDLNHCGGTDTIIVNEPDNLSLLTSPIATSCNNSSDGGASVIVSGGVGPYTYLWNDPSGQTTTTASSLAAGAYTVWVTDINSCNSSATVSVSEPSAISSTLNITSNYNGYAISCHGSSDATVTVSATTGGSPGGYTYSTDAINYSPNNTFTSLPAGYFHLWTKDINGCTGEDSIFINQPSVINPNITLQQNVTCIGGANGQVYIIITGGAPSYTCLWNTGATTPLITGLTEGRYKVTVTGSNGCIGTDSIDVTFDHELFTTITTTPVTCTGGSDGTASVIVSGTGDAPYSYIWSNGNTTASIIGIPAGWLSVTVTDANGCDITDTDTIKESTSPLIIAEIGVINLDCFGDSDGSITITVEGGTGPYNYSWNTSPIPQTTATASSLAADTFTVTVTDANGCTIIDSNTVTQPLQLSGVFYPSDISCFGEEDGSINTTISGGIAPYIYNWTGPSGFSNTTNNISGLELGSYTLLVTDNNLCNYSNTTIINEPGYLNVVIAVSIEPLCFGGIDGSIDLLVAGGTQPYSAILGGGLSTPIYPNSPSTASIIFEWLPAGGYSIYITDANGCEHVTYDTITQPSLLVIDSHSEVNPTCYDYSNGSATFSGTGGTTPYSYQVLDASGAVVGNSSTLSDGAYEYEITDDHGCSTTLSFNLTQPDEIIIIENTITNVNCFGGSTGSILIDVQNAIEPYEALWTGGYIGNSITDLSEGMYTATVRDDNNCWSTDSFYVDQNTAVAINYSTQNASCLTVADGMIFVNSFSGGTAPYSVYNNGNLHTQNEHVSTTIDALFTGTHSLLITDANNCEFTAQIILDFDGDYNCIVVPIIISPNMDGTNDTWKPILDLSTDIEVSILNRWGKLVYYYSGNSIGFEWDGLSTDNDKLPSMDYYYIIKFNNVNYLDKTGVITLIR